MKINTIHKVLRIQLTLVFLVVCQSFYAQYFEFGFTDEMRFSNNKNGFFSGFVGANTSYIYAINTNYAATSINANNKLKLVAYNKSSLSEVAIVPLKGFPENKARKEELAALRYFKTVVFDDHILVFWTRLVNTDSTKTEELYAESFNPDLEREGTMKKVYEVVQKVDVHQSEFALPSFVLVPNQETGELLVGSELHKPNRNVVLRYTTMNSRLSGGAIREFQLPAICGESQNGLVCSYDLGEDGNLYVRSTIYLSKDEIIGLRPHEPKQYLVLSVLNPKTSQETELQFRGPNKTITDFNLVVEGNSTRVVGFFGDLEKDPSGIDKQGIFYADIKGDSLAPVALKYTYFERTTLNKIFPRTKGGRRKTVDKETMQELIDTRYDIEKVFFMEDSSVVLFFNRKYNYSEITSRSGMDGKNIYKTSNYCEKNNVSAIRLSREGKILWTSNVERTITYDGFDVPDIRVIYKYGKFFVFYGTEPEKKYSKKKKKKELDLREELIYATVDPVSGRAKTFDLEVNPEKTDPKERRTVDPNSICVYANNFYFSKMVVKQKLAWYAANVLCFPSIYYSALSGNVKTAKGELGVMIVMDGKPGKKRN